MPPMGPEYTLRSKAWSAGAKPEAQDGRGR